MKKAFVLFTCVMLCLAGLSFIRQKEPIGVQHTLDYFNAQAKGLVTSLENLQSAIRDLSSQDKNTVSIARASLVHSRKAYKRIEFFVTYFFSSRIAIFNPAPVYEIEEPFMEYQAPVGLQVIEGILYDPKPYQNKERLLNETALLLNTAQGLSSFLFGRKIHDEEILESIRLQLIRLMTLGITGYDAPQLKSGIEEAAETLLSISQNLQPYLTAAPLPTASDVKLRLQQAMQALASGGKFDDFDRLNFLTQAALPLQQSLGNLIHELDLSKSSTPALNYGAANLFSRDALNIRVLNGSSNADTAFIAFGKKLFFDTRLSGNNQRSCATCHNPRLFFSDGLDKSPAFNGHDKVPRNAPSIIYAAYQYGQFWDARSASLEEQILQVLQSKTEMNAGAGNFEQTLSQDGYYQQVFKATSQTASDSFFGIRNIARAIAAYESSLPIMTSRFDEYMLGHQTALTTKEIKGFNLFMGKAQCGTCHFAPLFNGLLPPRYDRTELESLGMTASANFRKAVADKDSGRFAVFPIEFYQGTFKTPTVRNSAATAPYMHNGAFNTLTEVIEFYNKGGGAGLGLDLPYQTLSSKPLQLTPAEKSALLSFLKSLTDKAAVN